MSSFLELATSRRSIRSYSEREVKREDLERCVEAARLSPSACNSQPWKFIIIDDKEKKEEVSRKVISGLYNMNAFAKSASAFIAVVSEKTKPPAWAGGKLMRTDFRKIDIGIASAHLVLQAQELGLGTCILGWFNERNLKKILSVPRSKKVELLVSFGYPDNSSLRDRSLKDKSSALSVNRY